MRALAPFAVVSVLILALLLGVGCKSSHTPTSGSASFLTYQSSDTTGSVALDDASSETGDLSQDEGTDNEESTGAAGQSPSFQGGIAVDEVIAILREGSTESDAKALAAEHDARLLQWIPELFAAVLKLDVEDGKLPAHVVSGNRRVINSMDPAVIPDLNRALSRLSADPKVKTAQPHHFGRGAQEPFEPNDPHYVGGFQYYHDIGTPYVWAEATGDPSVTIAILDSGVDLGHEEFAGRILRDPDILPYPDGPVDPEDIDFGSRDFIDPPAMGDGRATPGNGVDDNGDGFTDEAATHGSRVASIALAEGNNSVGMAGFDWNAKILSLRIGPANGEISPWSEVDCIRAMMYTLKFPDVRIINISAVYPRDSILLEEATKTCLEYGKLVVAAAGNDAEDTPLLCAPAFYDEAFAVGGTEGFSEIWDDGEKGTNYGEFLDILAPATSIFGLSSNGDGSFAYNNATGTSFAAPMVSGLAGLILAGNPAFTADDLRLSLPVGAISFNGKYPELAGKLGAGLVVAYSAYTVGAVEELALEKVRTNGRGAGFWEIDLFFSRRLHAPSATDVSNYEVTLSGNPVNVERAVLMDDGQRVRILTGTQATGAKYTLLISGILSEDGNPLYPTLQAGVSDGATKQFDLLSSGNGGIAEAVSEFDPGHSAQMSNDGSENTFWFAEILAGESVELAISLPQAETVNQVVIKQRIPEGGEDAYSQTSKLWAAGLYDPDVPALSDPDIAKESWILLMDEAKMNESGEFVLSNGATETLNFPLVRARYIVLQCIGGDDKNLDGDGLSNGVSVSTFSAYRQLDDEDTYAPWIASMLPNAGRLGATVKIAGDSFGNDPLSGRLFFGGIEAIVLNWTNDEITALVPYNPFSVPVIPPAGIPLDVEPATESDDPVTLPADNGAVLPQNQDAESGFIIVRRGEFMSNPKWFEVID